MSQTHAVAYPVNPSKGKNIALWVLQIVLAAFFLMAGGSKLAGAPAMVQLFDTLGFGQWFRYVTGAIEVAAAILLVIPGMSRYGAVLVVATMIGAVAAHVAVLHSSPATPAVLGILAGIVLWGRWQR